VPLSHATSAVRHSPTKASRSDLCGQLGAVKPAAVRAPVREGAVLGDDHGPFNQFYLLHHARRCTWGRLERSAAVRALLERIEARFINLVGRKRWALVTRMSRLAAALASLAVRGRGRLGLDDVVGGRPMGVGGVPAQTGDFGLQLLDASLELRHQRLQLGYTGRKPFAVRAFGCRCICHAQAEYTKAWGENIRFSKNRERLRFV
jgi:hypothetical protein